MTTKRLSFFKTTNRLFLFFQEGGNTRGVTIEFDALRREKEIEIRYMETENMPADMFTKTLNRNLFQKHRNLFMQGNRGTNKNERAKSHTFLQMRRGEETATTSQGPNKGYVRNIREDVDRNLGG